MKNINKIIVLIIPMFIAFSCVDDDKLFELSDFENGAIPNLQRTANDDGIIDLLDLDNAVMEFTMDFAVNFEQSPDGGITSGGSGREGTNLEFAEVSSVDLEVSYANAVTGDIETGTIRSGITSWPETITLGVSDLIEAIPSLNSNTDINLADQFVIVGSVNLASGTRLPAFVNDPNGKPVPGYSINFVGAGNNPGIDFSLTYNVSCQSSIPLGAYNGVTAGPGGTMSSAVVTITAGALPGQYNCDDLSAGMLGQLIGNPTFLGGGAFVDVCNIITVPTFAPPGLVNVIQWADNPGSYDPGTGVIVINWDIIGFQHTTTLTPQ